ncbi:MAG: hemerythrin domain-containing protein [Bacteroidetes bacterium]|nr:hemerythrin domain-containing protein [Bacteroidota bacterium]
MKPTKELKHEHEIILYMLSGAERLMKSILSTGEVDASKVSSIIEFSKIFTDGCHHSKEEKHLFIKLVERGMSKEQGPVAVMLNEHQAGRDLIRRTEAALKDYDAGKKEAGENIGKALLQYIELLRSHIAKENNILFPMADRLMTAEDKQMLEQSFKKVEEKETGAGVHEKYHRMAHEIAG